MRENFFWHKLHSLSGIVPVGYYMLQHLLLNTFSLAGPAKFDGVIHFFDSMPKHFLLGLEVVAIWIPLLFHAVYGVFITARWSPNYTNPAYRYRENRYYSLQRITGVAAFLFLIYHVTTTSLQGKLNGVQTIEYAAWAERLAWPNGLYIGLGIYVIGVALCSYHFGYGIWNFCIRWGITVSEKAQMTIGKVSAFCFVAITLIGWAALFGFLKPIFATQDAGQVQVHAPAPTHVATTR